MMLKGSVKLPAQGILEECGFKYYAEFKERRPIFFKV